MARKLTRVQSEGIKDSGVRSEDLVESAVGFREINAVNKATAVSGQVLGLDSNGDLAFIAGGASGSTNLSDIRDDQGNFPEAGEAIVWDGSEWVAAPISGLPDASTLPPYNAGDVVVYDAVSQDWVVLPNPNAQQLPDTALDGQILVYSVATGEWVAQDMPAGTGGSSIPTFGTEPADGDFDDGRAGKTAAVKGLTSASRIVDGFDALNEIVGLLLPESPDALSSKTLSFTGPSVRFANGYVDNTGAGPAAGDAVPAAVLGSGNSATVTSFGSGNSGTLQAVVNGVVAGSIDLDQSDNTGTDGVLEILSNTDYPATTPGFWQSINARITGLATSGYNDVKLVHTETGETNTVGVLVDHNVGAPVVTLGALTEGTASTVLSSGVPHYASGSVLTMSFDSTGMATDAYKASGIATITASNGISSSSSLNPGQGGTPTILDKDVANVAFSGVNWTPGSNVHGQGQISVKTSNPWVESTPVTFPAVINVMSGNASSSVIDEMLIDVRSSLGAASSGKPVNGVRVVTSDFSAWDQSTLPSDEAAVVGGRLSHNTVDYTGHMPAGPDYSGKAATQYFTFEFFRRAVSQFDITINGTYSALEVQLPGVSGGWWDMGQLYPGSGLPNPGCALGSIADGSAGTYTCTFGTQSSTNATDERVLVRIAMEAGDSISSIIVKEV